MSQTATESRGGEQIPNIPAQPFQFSSCLVSLQGCLQNWAGWTKFSFTQTQFNLYLRPRPVRRDECWFRRLLCCSAPCSRWMAGIYIYIYIHWCKGMTCSHLSHLKVWNEILAGLLMIYRTILAFFRKILFLFSSKVIKAFIFSHSPSVGQIKDYLVLY